MIIVNHIIIHLIRNVKAVVNRWDRTDEVARGDVVWSLEGVKSSKVFRIQRVSLNR